jgi:hypothetical protein
MWLAAHFVEHLASTNGTAQQHASMEVSAARRGKHIRGAMGREEPSCCNPWKKKGHN